MGSTDENHPYSLGRRVTTVEAGLRAREAQGVRAVAALRRMWTQAIQQLATIDWFEVAGRVMEYQVLMPTNLRGRAAILVSGREEDTSSIPLAWVVPPDLAIVLLTEYRDDAARLALLLDEQAMVLDFCEAAISVLDFGAAAATRASIDAFRGGHVGPAQSHAANVIDSIVLAAEAPLRPGAARRHAIARASFDPDPDELVRAYVDSIVLGPLAHAYIHWFPGGDEPLPTGFARHVTAHAAHIEETFRADTALVAVMLAASLCIHYRHELAPAGAPPVPPLSVTPSRAAASEEES